MNIKTKNVCWLLAAVVVFCASLVAGNAKAETAVYAGAWSKHLVTGDEYDYTSSHDLFAVEYKRVFAARFRNSYGRESYALGYTWSKQYGNFEAKVVAGAVRGYRGWYGDSESTTKTLPLVVPMVSYTKYKIQPTVLLMGEALAASVRIEF